MGKIPAAHPPRRSLLNRSHTARAASLACLLALSGLFGCTEGAPTPLTLTVHDLPSPAGADSGEPFLSSAGDTVLMSWLGRSPTGSRRLLVSMYTGGDWLEPRAIVESDRLLVNVSDFPSVRRGGDGALWAHWLERDAEGFGYGVRLARSEDAGRSWSDPWIPHEDRSATDHGFVATFETDSGIGLVWLDGRGFAAGAGSEPSMETALFFRGADRSGPAGAEVRLDPRVCDCCQTDVAITSDGALAVYRDRSDEEVRDIRTMRNNDGRWVEGPLVHEDGWETGACPINGPAVAAAGDRVAVAWFTAAEGEARVLAAFSDDAGRGFGDPIRIDDGVPAGRVDVALLADGSALVAWMERTGGAGTDVRVRRVGPAGHRLESVSASAAVTERAMGFPRLAHTGDGAIIVAWTDGAELAPRVRVTRIELENS